MISQDAQNLTNSIREMENKATKMAHILNCIAINMQCLTDSLKCLEQNTTAAHLERANYEDFEDIA